MNKGKKIKDGCTILVTGASGFLGWDIAEYLQSCGNDVTGIDKNESSETVSFDFRQLPLPSEGFDALLQSLLPEVLVHAAGTASVPFSMEYPYDDFKASVNLYAALLDSVRKHCPRCRIIFLSSAAVYGNPLSLPISESSVLNPVSAYGFHKLIGEELSRAYFSLFKVGVCNLRIFSAYGERLRRQVVFDMAMKLLSGSEVVLFGTGEESRDFIHSRDVARAVDFVIRHGDFSCGIYNVASGRETRIADLADQMRKLINPDAIIKFDGKTRSGDPCRWQAEIKKLNALGFTPELSLGAGLQRVTNRWHYKK